MKPIIVRSAVALVAGVFLVGCVEQERVPRPADQAGSPVATSHPPVRATGVTNMQSIAPSGQDCRTRATQVVALASLQIDRLERPSTANGNRSRVGIDTALADLQSKRAKLQEDMREIDAQPAMQEDSAFAEIDRCADLADLETAVRASYSILPPPPQGRP
jgi:hypothetical protein